MIMDDINYGHATHVGHVSKQNDDSYLVDTSTGLWIVSDGLGGHESGDVASAIVVESIAKSVQKGLGLVDALAVAHKAILKARSKGKGSTGMAATAVALKLNGNQYEVGWIGDSRAYLWDQKLHQLTSDHTYVQRLVDDGELEAEEAQRHPERSFLTQALGTLRTQDVSPETISGHLSHENQVMLCSDGLTDELSDVQIASILGQEMSEQKKVDSLIQSALDNGGSDNITVLLISV
ncbi:protein phosphatase [Mariprofundus aestuarium]|uniref:Protein phosphatase n=1 Tax=Mariprofundus aestuarium TaxID=1921086 RepID=A0A2K8L0I1_MARES|nr:protein phosphatase 2C domain-containing protein [Mariprofundus aestuarium]ATX79709.1 protein phosphatase [Mariprofundus aestuarium]